MMARAKTLSIKSQKGLPPVPPNVVPAAAMKREESFGCVIVTPMKMFFSLLVIPLLHEIFEILVCGLPVPRQKRTVTRVIHADWQLIDRSGKHNIQVRRFPRIVVFIQVFPGDGQKTQRLPHCVGDFFEVSVVS